MTATQKQDKFNSHVEPTVLTGESAASEFTILSAGVSSVCQGRFAGTMKTKAATEITVHPTFTKCVVH